MNDEIPPLPPELQPFANLKSSKELLSAVGKIDLRLKHLVEAMDLVTDADGDPYELERALAHVATISWIAQQLALVSQKVMGRE